MTRQISATRPITKYDAVHRFCPHCQISRFVFVELNADHQECATCCATCQRVLELRRIVDGEWRVIE